MTGGSRCRRYVVNKVKGKLDELGRERTQLNVEKGALQREKEELQQQVEELARSVEKLNRDKVMLERELEAEEEQVTAKFVLLSSQPLTTNRTRKVVCQRGRQMSPHLSSSLLLPYGVLRLCPLPLRQATSTRSCGARW